MRLSLDEVGNGPALVLLHGFPFDRTMWDAQKRALSASYRVITPDLRGHGNSPAPAGEFVHEIDVMADDVIETLDDLGLTEPVALGGLSMGGYVALSVAARYLARLRALILMDTRAGADTPEAASGRLETAQKLEASGDLDPVVSGMIPRLFAPGSFKAQPGIISEVDEMMRRNQPLDVSATLRGLAARPDRTADLPAITCPALVLVGAEDAITPPEEARRMARAIPRCQFVEVEGAGHLAPMERPDAVNQAVLDFLASLK